MFAGLAACFVSSWTMKILTDVFVLLARWVWLKKVVAARALFDSDQAARQKD